MKYIHFIEFKTSRTFNHTYMDSFLSDNEIPTLTEVTHVVAEVLRTNGHSSIASSGDYHLGLCSVSTVLAK